MLNAIRMQTASGSDSPANRAQSRRASTAGSGLQHGDEVGGWQEISDWRQVRIAGSLGQRRVVFNSFDAKRVGEWHDSRSDMSDADHAEGLLPRIKRAAPCQFQNRSDNVFRDSGR